MTQFDLFFFNDLVYISAKKIMKYLVINLTKYV